MDILTNIIHLLKERNKKQVDLTNYLCVTKNIFTDWKSGRNNSYMKHLPKIAEFFDVSVDYLLGNEIKTEENNFTYALYNEITHDLTQEQIDQLKKYADFLRTN